MVTFFKRSQVWAVQYQWDGHTRHLLKALPEQADAAAQLRAELQDLFGDRARLVSVRLATADEELDYVRGNLPRNAYCPTGKMPLAQAWEPEKAPDQDGAPGAGKTPQTPRRP